jgi:acyl-coenzyme A thioesterase PaaI-like protein
VVKAGRTLALAEVWFRVDGDDEPAALAQTTFMASPNPAHLAEGGFPLVDRPRPSLLAVPFADRAGVRVDGGAVEVPHQPEGLNASGGINGGLIALIAEEAALAAAPVPSTAQSLSLRYLRPFTVGPARATATVSGPLARVQVVDAGNAGKLGTVASLRLTPAS